jgi:hypothetical protein
VEHDADTVLVDGGADPDPDAETLSSGNIPYGPRGSGDSSGDKEQPPIPVPATRFLLMRMVGNDLPPKHPVCAMRGATMQADVTSKVWCPR